MARLMSDWVGALLGGDLERADCLLSKGRGFFACAMRARIASLLLRQQAASEHFRKCAVAIKRAKKTQRNIARLLLTSAYAVENSIVASRPTKALSATCARLLRCSNCYAKSRRIELARRQIAAIHARVLLGIGRNADALRIYQGLAAQESKESGPAENLGFYYQGMAAARTGLGQDPRPDLETAGFYCLISARVLHQARLAGILAASWRYLHCPAEGDDWFLFLSRLNCPQATKVAIVAHAELLMRRSTQARQLVAL